MDIGNLVGNTFLDSRNYRTIIINLRAICIWLVVELLNSIRTCFNLATLSCVMRIFSKAHGWSSAFTESASAWPYLCLGFAGRMWQNIKRSQGIESVIESVLKFGLQALMKLETFGLEMPMKSKVAGMGEVCGQGGVCFNSDWRWKSYSGSMIRIRRKVVGEWKRIPLAVR